MIKMINLFKNVFWYIIEEAYTVLLGMLKYIPRAHKVCEKSVENDLGLLAYVIDKSKRQCKNSVEDDPDRYQDQGYVDFHSHFVAEACT